MTGRPEGGKAAPASDTDMTAFYDTANEFLEVANRLIGIEPTGEIAAAFLYACARYNSFAMQAQAADAAAIDAQTVDYLATEFERHLRKHMLESLGAMPGGPDDPRQVIGLIERLNDRDGEDLSDFLDLGDRYIDVANRLIATQRVSRISAAFMHACARFNVYALQGFGHPPGMVGEDLVAAFRETYVNLVDQHLRETLVAPRG